MKIKPTMLVTLVLVFGLATGCSTRVASEGVEPLQAISSLDEEAYRQLLARPEAQGFDLERLERSEHREG